MYHRSEGRFDDFEDTYGKSDNINGFSKVKIFIGTKGEC